MISLLWFFRQVHISDDSDGLLLYLKFENFCWINEDGLLFF